MDDTFPVALVVEQSPEMGHDRALCIEHPEALVIVVADGSGGQGGGGEAADLVVASVRRSLAAGLVVSDKAAWCALLVDIDRAIEEDATAGETTAVVLALSRRFLVGASVGDSRAVHFTRTGPLDLTERQERRPLLGSGGALPVPIVAPSRVGTLVVGTDGLYSYLALDRLQRLALRDEALERRSRALLDAVRLPSGSLNDDVAFCVVDTL